MPNNTNLVFMVSSPKNWRDASKETEEQYVERRRREDRIERLESQDTLRDDPMHFEGRGLAIPGLFSVAMLGDFAVKHCNQRLSFTRWLDIAKPPRSLNAKPNSRKRFYDKESKQSEATA